MGNPLKQLSKKEWILWIGSLFIVVISNLWAKDSDFLTLIAALVGVTSLIFAAIGNVWAQILMIVFSILYGIISWRFRYFGEMITYLGMTLPMAVWSFITWYRHPSKENENEVEIRHLQKKDWLILIPSTVAVTALFYFLLKQLDTPNLGFSTLSITTSFLAAALTVLRSSYYALFYAMNDLVLIVLWTLASLKFPGYIPVVVNFIIFFVNDMYGFVCWRKRETT